MRDQKLGRRDFREFIRRGKDGFEANIFIELTEKKRKLKEDRVGMCYCTYPCQVIRFAIFDSRGTLKACVADNEYN
jgi:hypothetical protein